jgi:hypothetical protein
MNLALSLCNDLWGHIKLPYIGTSNCGQSLAQSESLNSFHLPDSQVSSEVGSGNKGTVNNPAHCHPDGLDLFTTKKQTLQTVSFSTLVHRFGVV